jgi:hypothetical protein
VQSASVSKNRILAALREEKRLTLCFGVGHKDGIIQAIAQNPSKRDKVQKLVPHGLKPALIFVHLRRD